MTFQELPSIKTGYATAKILWADINDLQTLPLDQRILSIREEIQKSNILLLNATKDELLTEKESGPASAIRKNMVDVSRQLDLDFSLIADNVEGVVLIQTRDGSLKLKERLYHNARLVFVPEMLFESLVKEKAIDDTGFDQTVKSRKWKSEAGLSKPANRFEKELADWHYLEKDPPEMSPDREKMAEVLGMDVNALKRRNEYVNNARNQGFLVGETIGKAHAVNWTGTDLTLEHFVQQSADQLYWIDHANDIFLLREIEVEEAAATLVTLYRQMDYYQWSGFRRGYLQEMAMKGADILSLFDGKIVYKILAYYLIDHVRGLRRANKTGEALQKNQLCVFLFEKHEPDLTQNLDYHKARLITGDIYLSMADFTKAIRVYEQVIKELGYLDPTYSKEALKSKSGGIINLSICYFEAKDHAKALSLLNDAQELAEQIRSFDEKYGDYLMKVILRNRELFSGRKE